MPRKKVLLVCGSMNQTTQMHAVQKELTDCDCYFTEFYTTGFYKKVADAGLLNFTAVFKQQPAARAYFKKHALLVDTRGEAHRYDLVLLCTDLIVPDNHPGVPKVLVQEGMTDPETILFPLVKKFQKYGFPRWVDRTATNGMSDAYVKFCVASEGYKHFFAKKGIRTDKMVVTGIPNFDNVQGYLSNSFPHKGYVLVATSDLRETFWWDNRRKFLRQCKEIAAGRPILFKLHPNENAERARKEIAQQIPQARVFTEGNPHEMVANCDVFISQYTTLVFTAIPLGKQIHSYFDVQELKRICPVQNGGTSGRNIAAACRQVLAA